jgi:hypothetical protein
MDQETQTQTDEQSKELNDYQKFFVNIHPQLKQVHPDWTPQQLTTEIGRRWSLRSMKLMKEQHDVVLTYKDTTYRIPGCGQEEALYKYLEYYRVSRGHESLLQLVQGMSAVA